MRLNKKEIKFFKENGYIKVSDIFEPHMVNLLGKEMIRIINEWGQETIGWPGPWRNWYLGEENSEDTKAIFMHNPHYYSAVWSQALLNPYLTTTLRCLIGDNIQWHHSVLHAKPPKKGTPFPMHQDYPFYPHDGDEVIACLLHLDDTPSKSGPLCVIPGSHKKGSLEHITGLNTAPHLSPEDYHPDKSDWIEVPCRQGDIIFFSYYLIHWSNVNLTDEWRRSVRMVYHKTGLKPTGYTKDQPYNNLIVSGFKSNK